MVKSSAFEGLLVEHARFQNAAADLTQSIRLARASGGGIVPLLGPTRCGKTDLVENVCEVLGEDIRGPSYLLPTSTFARASIPPKPNDQDIYRAMLAALGFRHSKTEKVDGLRDRVFTTIADQGRQVVVLDECSHCAESGANFSARAATDHFKTIVDTTGVVLVLAGLPKFQKLIDGNEQFRDRAMRTVELHPYQWSDADDREGFLGAIFPLIEAVCKSGHELLLDEGDFARRLYGASGGRVGRVVEYLSHVLVMYENQHELNLEDFAGVGRRTLQRQINLPDMFEAEPPTDYDLERSYVGVMQDAGLPVRAASIHTFGAQNISAAK